MNDEIKKRSQAGDVRAHSGSWADGRRQLKVSNTAVLKARCVQITARLICNMWSSFSQLILLLLISQVRISR